MNAGMNSAMEDATNFSMEIARLAGIYLIDLKVIFKENLSRQNRYKKITKWEEYRRKLSKILKEKNIMLRSCRL